MRAPAIKSVLLFAAAACFGYVAGINAGYTQGFDAAVNSGRADAAVLASVLAALDSENSEQARTLLEGHLDSLLIDNTIGPSISSIIDPRRSEDQSAYEALMGETQDCRTAGGSSGWQRLQ